MVYAVYMHYITHKTAYVCTQPLFTKPRSIWARDMEVEPSTAFNLMEMGVPKTLVALVVWLQFRSNLMNHVASIGFVYMMTNQLTNFDPMKLRCYSLGGARTSQRLTQLTFLRSLVGLPTLPSGGGWSALNSSDPQWWSYILIRSSYPPWLRHKCGFKCASFDFTYGQAKSQGNPMDFNQPPGFLYLGECSGSDHIYI